MRTNYLLLFIWLTSLSFSQRESACHQCISYTQYDFDADTCCWRKLSAEGKHKDAGVLILLYLEKSKNIRRRHPLEWHAGHMFAFSGDYSLAKKYFRKTYSIFYKWFGGTEGKAWYYYAKGTIAFINGDKETLTAIISHWQRSLPPDINLGVLKGLEKNWDKSYGEATSI